jgi:hypothetical protein
MGQEVAIPAWAEQGPADAFRQLAVNGEDSLSEGIGQGYPVIGYRGKTWSVRYRGERKNIIRPDDGTPAAYLDVIILGQAKNKSKSFYKKYEPGQSDGERPICSSIDGVRPDPDVTSQQSATCALCPRNVWRTDPNTGRKGRECTDYKRLAVLIVPTQTTPVFGAPLLEPAFLRVPPASLNALAIMGDSMSNKGYHYSSYVTRITFDPQKPHPEMQFKPIQALAQDEAPVILQLRQDIQVERIVSGGFADAMRTIPSQLPSGQTLGLSQGSVQQSGAQTVAPSTAGPSPQGPMTLDMTALQPLGNGLRNLVSVPPATPKSEYSGSAGPSLSGPSPTPAPTTGLGLSSLASSGGATPAEVNPTQSQPTQQQVQPQENIQPQSTGLQTSSPQTTQNQVGDAGVVEATDFDIEARIAKLMAGKK